MLRFAKTSLNSESGLGCRRWQGRGGRHHQTGLRLGRHGPFSVADRCARAHRGISHGHGTYAQGQVCERWAVLASTLEPADMAKQLTDMSDWCVLVVGDENGPTAREFDMAGVTYLSAHDQEKLPYRIAGPSASNKPGRKNIGFMYAIHHGAEVVYDLDNDKYLTDFLAELPLYESDAVVGSRSVHSHAIERKGPSTTSLRSQPPRVQARGVAEEALALRQDWLLDLRDAGHDIWQHTEQHEEVAGGGMPAAVYPNPIEQRALAEGTAPDVDVHAVAPSGGGKIPHVMLVIAVVSARSDRRDAIRESWRKWGDERVEIRFFTEAPPSGDPDAGAAAAALAEEMATHGDVLIMDIEPGMNFALKLLWSMRWMSERFTFDFFLRLDDDYFLCLERLLNELNATLAAAEHPLRIYAGHRYCEYVGQIRIDEAYLLLSAPLVNRILVAPNLRCGGHGGVSVAWWLTNGNALNRQGDVEWVDDFRLDHVGDLFLSGSSKDFADVCVTHMGVHHAYADTIPEMWRAAQGRPGPGPNDHSRAGSLLRYVDDRTCKIGGGVSAPFFEEDNVQLCDTFKAEDVAVHCGEEGCLDPPNQPAVLPAESPATHTRWREWDGILGYKYAYTVPCIVSFLIVVLVFWRCARRRPR
ncbi:unnamed protein product [Scytosiphon promiscuus]